MSGETAKSEAICLGIIPWSRTSHIVKWLTRRGRLLSVVKGAVRPKSQFLGQYDLNYTCEIVHYLGGAGELHALRECVPVKLREGLRGDYRRLLLAEHFRTLAETLAPPGDDAGDWFLLLDRALDRLADGDSPRPIAELIDFELKVLDLSGLSPDISAAGDSIELRGERRIPVSREVADCLANPLKEEDPQILLDAARVIGVFYSFHLDFPPDGRRAVLKAIS